MGIDSAATQFLCAARAAGVDFTEAATLGRQSFYPTKAHLIPVANVFKRPGGVSELIADCNGSGDRFLELLGAKTVTSFDADDYEGASVVHDMNEPIPREYHAKFSAVIDGGTIEHVFNITQCLKNCLEMVKLGGHFLSIQVANNFLGHGFYQLSPEFFFRTLTDANGYRIVTLMLCTLDPLAFYGVRDPQRIQQRRVILINDRPTYILVMAERIACKELFACHPQQSDYAASWAKSTLRSTTKHPGRPREPSSLDRLKQTVPDRIKTAIKGLIGYNRYGFAQPAFYRVSVENMMRGNFLDGES